MDSLWQLRPITSWKPSTSILKEDSQRQRESKKSHFDESSEDDDSESLLPQLGYDWSSSAQSRAIPIATNRHDQGDDSVLARKTEKKMLRIVSRTRCFRH